MIYCLFLIGPIDVVQIDQYGSNLILIQALSKHHKLVPKPAQPGKKKEGRRSRAKSLFGLPKSRVYPRDTAVLGISAPFPSAPLLGLASTLKSSISCKGPSDA